MALRKLTKTFTPSGKEIRYLNKTFPEFRQSLIDFAKVYYPNTYNDFNESSPGMMMIEMVAAVGDVLSYYIDSQFRENLLQYAQESDNIISIAQSLGYKPKPSTAASCDLDVYQLCPALDFTGNYAPDPTFLLRVDAGMVVGSPQFNVQFRTTEIIDFGNPDNREISVYAVDGLNKPLTYLVKKTVNVVAGTIKTFTQTFGSPQRFTTIQLPDTNVLEIISVLDSNGNTWSEVDYLAQDLVFDDTFNTKSSGMNQSVAPYYLLKVKRTPRRFVTRYNKDFYLQLQFGSGVLDDTDATINLDPNKIASDEYQTNLASTSLDPADFLSSQSYGLAPSNIQLIIKYTVGGGVQSNVPSNAIIKVDSVSFLNDTSGFSASQKALFANIQSSLAVNNTNSATGGKDSDSVEEIRQNAMGFFNAQNRIVTPEDYVVRCFAMPPKYGGVAKVFVARDEQLNNISRLSNNFAPQGGTFVTDSISPNVVNLYVLGLDNNANLTTLNSDTKNNLATYLDNYRILTDQINILDAFIINIAVDFHIIVYKNYNMNDVLAGCIDAISQFFDTSSWDINQPIILNDLYLQIGQVDGVQSVSDVTILNRYAFQDGSDYGNFLYDIASATDNGIIYPSLDPSIFELRYPQSDIVGHAAQ